MEAAIAARPGQSNVRVKSQLGREIIIRALSDIGVLADITRIVAEKGISIKAACCWVEGTHGIIHLVTDDNLRACDALRKVPYEVREAKVVLTELRHKPGMLKHLTELLKVQAIDIHHLYATADGTERCLVVMSTSDNDRAVVVVNRN